MSKSHAKRVATLSIAAVVLITNTTQPVAAAHGTLPCPVPEELLPLFELLHTLTQVAFLGGVGLATLGFTAAGLLIAGPFGEDYAQRGKQLAKQVFIGTILLLSANMVVAFLISQLGGSFCT